MRQELHQLQKTVKMGAATWDNLPQSHTPAVAALICCHQMQICAAYTTVYIFTHRERKIFNPKSEIIAAFDATMTCLLCLHLNVISVIWINIFRSKYDESCLQNTAISIYYSVDTEIFTRSSVALARAENPDAWMHHSVSFVGSWLVYKTPHSWCHRYTLCLAVLYLATCCHLAEAQCQLRQPGGSLQTCCPDLAAETAEGLDARARLGSIWKSLTHAKLIKSV